MVKKIKEVKFGTDPMDPWSPKANIAEGGGLETYLMSRGIDPKRLSRETKISHAKSTAYLKWKKDHTFEEVEHFTEDKWLDKFLSSRGVNPHFATKKMKIAHAKSGEFIKWKRDHMFEGVTTQHTPAELALHKIKKAIHMHKEIPSNGKKKMTALDKFRAAAAEREKKHNEIAKNSGGMTKAIDRLQQHLNKEEIEQLDEISKETLASYRDKAMVSNKNAKKNREASEAGKDMSKGFADLHSKANAIIKKRIKGLSGYLQRKHGMKPGYEDQRKQTTENTLDPLAATEAPTGPGECGCDSNLKKQMSKSARIIKSIYKRKNMKEETYDWEKDDKDQTSPGKKPKISKEDEKSSYGDNKPQARAVLSGGTTLTGEKRDTVEIDPMMNNRPDLNGNYKDDNNKKKNKINN